MEIDNRIIRVLWRAHVVVMVMAYFNCFFFYVKFKQPMLRPDFIKCSGLVTLTSELRSDMESLRSF